MSTEPTIPPSGGNPDPSGTPDDPNNPKTVSHETHRKLLGEKKAEQEKRQAAEAELEKFRAKEREAETKKLEAEGKYAEALKLRDEELTKEKAKNAQILEQITEARKKTAILREISGKVPEKALALLPLDMITIGDDGKPDPLTVKAAAQHFEKEYSFAVQKDTSGGGLPPEAPPGGSGKKLAHDEWLKLPAAEMKKRSNEVDWSTAK